MNQDPDELPRPLAAPEPERHVRRTGDMPARPRWVKTFGIAALILVVLFVAIHLAGGGMGHH
ncbi:hypothetical protein [Pseudarthrobacter albicanus]|uniref:hypothetical protein n=1 Tax=Pseudarthrobacter TaxID=1742993 RepID=UPI001BAD7014|nr:hypothetical protein [Pseudarthrobacter albicanus]